MSRCVAFDRKELGFAKDAQPNLRLTPSYDGLRQAQAAVVTESIIAIQFLIATLELSRRLHKPFTSLNIGIPSSRSEVSIMVYR